MLCRLEKLLEWYYQWGGNYGTFPVYMRAIGYGKRAGDDDVFISKWHYKHIESNSKSEMMKCSHLG